MSDRVSGLSDDHAAYARKLIARSCRTMVANKHLIRYSQGSDRWVGINHELSIIDGRYPRTCDCSSTHTWMLWDAICRTYGVRDLVNGQNWNAGWTGSMYRRGKLVVHDKNLKIGDGIFYGSQGGGIPSHVATYIGGGRVFSHGSLSGPYILGLDYRPDRRMSRRYI